MFSTRKRNVTLFMSESDELFKTSQVALSWLKKSLPGAILDCVMNFNEKIFQAGGTVSFKFVGKLTKIVVKLPDVAPEESNNNAPQMKSHLKGFFMLKISQTTKLRCKSVETVEMLIDKLPAEILRCIHENVSRVSQAGGYVKFSFKADQTQILVNLPSDFFATVSPEKPPRMRAISTGKFNTYV